MEDAKVETLAAKTALETPQVANETTTTERRHRRRREVQTEV